MPARQGGRCSSDQCVSGRSSTHPQGVRALNPNSQPPESARRKELFSSTAPSLSAQPPAMVFSRDCRAVRKFTWSFSATRPPARPLAAPVHGARSQRVQARPQLRHVQAFHSAASSNQTKAPARWSALTPVAAAARGRRPCYPFWAESWANRCARIDFLWFHCHSLATHMKKQTISLKSCNSTV